VSVGDRKYTGIRTAAELDKMLATGDTGKLAKRPVKTDFTCDIPLGFGISTDGRTVYGDRRYVEEIKSGKVRVSGMSAKQLIVAHIEHEVIEKAVDDGDNPVDLYEGAHPFGERAEHNEVIAVRGNDRGYEAALQPGLDRAYRRMPQIVAADLWAGPLLDEPTKRDKEILRVLRAKGCKDAMKASKREAGYGFGAEQCKRCHHFGGGSLAPCELVSGLVRFDRQCDWWMKAKGHKGD